MKLLIYGFYSEGYILLPYIMRLSVLRLTRTAKGNSHMESGGNPISVTGVVVVGSARSVDIAEVRRVAGIRR
jgi:hypothetical protein